MLFLGVITFTTGRYDTSTFHTHKSPLLRAGVVVEGPVHNSVQSSSSSSSSMETASSATFEPSGLAFL